MQLPAKSLILLFLMITLINESCFRYRYTGVSGQNTGYSTEITGSHEGLIPYEEGIASWYGGKFHGKLTANGEVYDMYGMTAAHKVLPLGSIVVVENLENGKRVIVRINDRGPFVKGRIIDLSYAAAKKLGFAEKGITRVRIYLTDSSEVDGICYSLQLGAFSVKENAFKFAETLNKKGIRARVVKVGDYYKIYAGKFSSKQDAVSYGEKLQIDYFIVNCH